MTYVLKLCLCVSVVKHPAGQYELSGHPSHLISGV